MKIIKESFKVNTVAISQTSEGTKCLFNSMSVASEAIILLSQLDRNITRITPTEYNGATGYTFTVLGTPDMYDTIALLGTYGYDMVQG